MSSSTRPEDSGDDSLLALYALEPQAFLRKAYLLLLGRPIDDGGRVHYGHRLDAGTPRIQILRELAASAEGRAAGRRLPGLSEPVAARWWHRLPLLRRLRPDEAGRDLVLEAWLTSRSLQLQFQAEMAALAGEFRQHRAESTRKLGQLQDEIVMHAGGHVSRDNWEALRGILNQSADRFIIEAYRFVLRREPQDHEFEHFRHLQSLGLGSHSLLASLLTSEEAHHSGMVAGLGRGRPETVVVPVSPAPAPVSGRPGALGPSGAAPADGTARVTVDEELLGANFRAKSGDPLVSVIIPVHGKLEYTLMCLRSIARNLPNCSFEVIVVDDCSPDNTVEELQRIFGLRLVINDVNLGFVRSCNHGSTHAKGRFLCFLNNDTEVRPGWLDELVGTYDMFPDAGLVGSKLVFPDGTLQEAGGIVWQDASAWNFGRGQDPTRSIFNYARETDYCSGASILIEAELFERLGRFDERFVPAYCEDASLAFAVRAAGKRVIYQPKSEVIHYEGVSHGTSTSSGVKAYQVVNQEKFHELWRDTLEREHFPNADHIPLARERSGMRRIVLVIDHYVPQPDRDAGSRTMWQFMRMFQQRGLAVKFWPDNLWCDPVYTPLLQNAGIEVLYGAEYVDRFEDWVREHGVYLEAVLLTRPHISVKYTAALRKYSKARLLYYGQDIHYLRLSRQLALKYDRDVEESMFVLEAQEKRLWGEVDAIYYPANDETAVVNDWLRQSSLPALAYTIPVYAFERFPDMPWANLAERRNLIFVAGFAHPPNSGAALWFASDVFPQLKKRYPMLKLSLIGSNPTAEVRALQSEDIAVTGYVSDEALEIHYRTARVSVAPLLFGGGMKGKVVEAMRFGIPCVTSPAGAQGLEEALGFLAVAERPEDFAQEVIRLLEDDALWVSRSQAAQLYAKRTFTVDALWEVVSSSVETRPFSNLRERFNG